MATADATPGFDRYDVLGTIIPGIVLLVALAVLFSQNFGEVEQTVRGLLSIRPGAAVLVVAAVFFLGKLATLFGGPWDPGRAVFREVFFIVTDHDRPTPTDVLLSVSVVREPIQWVRERIQQVRNRGGSGNTTAGTDDSGDGDDNGTSNGPDSAADDAEGTKPTSKTADTNDDASGDKDGDGPTDAEDRHIPWPRTAGIAFAVGARTTKSLLQVLTFLEQEWRAGGRLVKLLVVITGAVFVLVGIPIVLAGVLLPILIHRLLLALEFDDRQGLPLTPSLTEFVRNANEAADHDGNHAVAFRQAMVDLGGTTGTRARRLRARTALYHNTWRTLSVVLVLYALLLPGSAVKKFWSDVPLPLPDSLPNMWVLNPTDLVISIVVVALLQGVLGLRWWRTEYEYLAYVAAEHARREDG